MKYIPAILLAVAAAATSPANPVAAQGVAQKVTGAPDGEVRMSFAARPDVCGDGVNNIRWSGRHRTVRDDDDDVVYQNGDCPCVGGPVRVVFRVADHRVSRVKTVVGGAWRADARAVDLGTVSTRDAVAALLAIAQDGKNGGGENAIFPATLADSVTVWPQLLTIARNNQVPQDSRKQAVFWLSQVASDSATSGLADLAGSDKEGDEIRKQAVFALSQRPKDEGVPALIKVAKSRTSAEVRKSALFWLGQSEDPRALALFEDILSH
ncbi:MAG TPA: HEAT repeat domain-containing protein [Gemmatimonadales bacterium]|nr:HEAT repeat domain-containing protein [Gemmatimonadales bacterium]